MSRDREDRANIKMESNKRPAVSLESLTLRRWLAGEINDRGDDESDDTDDQ